MKWMKSLLAAAAGMILLSASASAASPQEKLPRLMDRVVPVPAALLVNSYRYMGKLKRFSIDAVMTSDEEFLDEMVVTYTHHVHMDLERPDRLHISTTGDLKEKEYYINRGEFTVYDLLTNYYGKLEVPKKIDDALDYLFEKYDVKTTLANILYTDLDKRIPPKDKGIYFGVSDIDDIPCHHVGFVTQTQEYQVWIEQGDRPLIRKFVIIDKTEPSLLRSAALLRWNLEPSFSDALFTFVPPEGAVQIDITPADEWEAQ